MEPVEDPGEPRSPLVRAFSKEMIDAAFERRPAYKTMAPLMTLRVISVSILALALMTGVHLHNSAFAQSIIPDPTLTPGAVRTTDVGEICPTGTRELRHWSRERGDRILAEYDLPAGPHPATKSIILSRLD
jgi:hypothetical protein